MTFEASSQKARSIFQRRKGLEFINVSLDPSSPVKNVKINLAHFFKNGMPRAGALS